MDSRPYWHGATGAAIAIALGIAVGVGVELAAHDTFQSVSLGLLGVIAVLLIELKISEVENRRTGYLADRILAISWLRDSITAITEAVTAGDRADKIVQAQLREDIEMLAHKAQESRSNRLIRDFNDNRVRLAQTRAASDAILAVTYDAIDYRLWSSDTNDEYWNAQVRFVENGHRIARIFVVKTRSPALLEAMTRHHEAGFEVYEVDLEVLVKVGLTRLARNLVIWDRTCCSTTLILDTGLLSETTYSFNDLDIRKATDDWFKLQAQSRRFRVEE